MVPNMERTGGAAHLKSKGLGTGDNTKRREIRNNNKNCQKVNAVSTPKRCPTHQHNGAEISHSSGGHPNKTKANFKKSGKRNENVLITPKKFPAHQPISTTKSSDSVKPNETAPKSNRFRKRKVNAVNTSTICTALRPEKASKSNSSCGQPNKPNAKTKSAGKRKGNAVIVSKICPPLQHDTLISNSSCGQPNKTAAKSNTSGKSKVSVVSTTKKRQTRQRKRKTKNNSPCDQTNETTATSNKSGERKVNSSISSEICPALQLENTSDKTNARSRRNKFSKRKVSVVSISKRLPTPRHARKAKTNACACACGQPKKNTAISNTSGKRMPVSDLHGVYASDVRKNNEKFLKDNSSYPKVKIITGRGLHSKDGKPVNKLITQKYLKENGYTFSERDKGGSLIVNIRRK